MEKYFTKRNIITGVCILVAFILGGFVGKISESNKYNKPIVSTSNAATPDTKTNEKAKKTEEKPEETKASITLLGEECKTNNFNFKILSVENTKQIDLKNQKSFSTDKNFITVRLQYTNISNTPLNLRSLSFLIVNSKDKKVYNLNTDISISLNSNLKHIQKEKNMNYLYDNVNPDMPAEIALVFETPAEADNTFCLGISNNNNPKECFLMNLF